MGPSYGPLGVSHGGLEGDRKEGSRRQVKESRPRPSLARLGMYRSVHCYTLLYYECQASDGDPYYAGAIQSSSTVRGPRLRASGIREDG